YEAIAAARQHKPDIILLDVMMPGVDGFETCKLIKQDPEISHIPVVMVTALSDQSDRVRGLEVGADDFLTKPINDMALFARVRSLVRIKVLLDELRLRDQTLLQMGIAAEAGKSFVSDVNGARVLLVDDDPVQAKQITAKLGETYQVDWLQEADVEPAVKKATAMPYDVIMVSALLMDEDGLRLASLMKSHEEIRHVPILMLVDEDDTATMLKVLEMGFNDYLRVPVDKNEMTARVRTQIRRKRYQEALRATYQQSISLAITDALTGLYNRHYLNTHLENMTRQSLEGKKPLTVMMMDMDHFKSVNDQHGHDAGDMVLKRLAEIILQSSRSADLVARYGGEEFVVLMPETGLPEAGDAAERLRKTVESTPFNVEGACIFSTISIGISTLKFGGGLMKQDECGTDLLKRADGALYEAKNGGRNQVKIAD
ncbi:MAG: PleD family two-component system response regulator, partial [Alphaproteobacteria bacterium]|nr:PleD family two-component system response regulator [Alphaproteobacteria bacterium]